MSEIQEAIVVADVVRAAGTEASRVSEVSARLGIERRRTGATPKKLTAEDAIRIVTVRRLQEAGVPLDAAVDAVARSLTSTSEPSSRGPTNVFYARFRVG